MIKRAAAVLVNVALLSFELHGASVREVPPAVVPPYANQRTPAPTDFVRLDWKDAKRDRAVPVKMYFPVEGSGPFPVIVFSHGVGGTRETYEYLGRQWAANGYVVVHLQHVGTDDSAWRGSTQPMQSMARAISVKTAIDRVLDERFAVDQLESLNASGDEKLRGKLDLKHIGMAGHSYGAHTTQATAGMRLGTRSSPDERITAAIAMSPHVPAMRGDLDGAFAGIKIPIFYMTGTKDDSPIGHTKAAERRIPFDHTKASAAAYFLDFAGGDHMIFSGRLRPGGPADHDADFQTQIRIASTAFWDAYLKDDAAARAWLNDAGGLAKSVGELGTLQKK